MRKLVPIKFQRILSYIPIINSLILFVWLYNFIRSGKSHGIFVKSLLVLLVCTAPLILIQIVVSCVFAASTLSSICDLIMVYLIPLSMGIGLIKYQKHVFEIEFL